MITITRGQWFPLTLGNIQWQGAAMDMTTATDINVALVSALGIRKMMKYDVSAYNELTCVQNGDVSAGKYSIEITCKDAEGRSYRMCSPSPILEISPTTAVSDAALSKMQVTGDMWELTADVEMHEAAARTYMSLLEEARQQALDAAGKLDMAVSVEDNGSVYLEY